MASRDDVRRLNGRVRTSANILAGQGRRLTRRDLQVLTATTLEPPLVPMPQPASEHEAMGLPPFGRAVALLTNAIAGTEWYARRASREYPGIWDRVPDQPEIVSNPYPLQTIWSYRWAVAEDGILYGNHFALLGDVDWRTGRPGWTVPLPADEVWLVTDPADAGWYEWVVGGVTFGADEIFHIPFGARSGRILGRGVLEQYGDWLGGAVAAEDYSRDTFAAGALPPAVITTNQATTQEQATDLKLKWRTLTSTREPVILPNGTVMTPVVGNAEQAQLVQARTWNAQMCADVVGVPGWKLGLDGPTMTYQNVETGDIDFVRDSVDRYGRPITEAVSKWLLPAGTELVWDYASRMRSDAKSTADVITSYVVAGVLTKDEARATINRPPLPTPAAAPPSGSAEGQAGGDATTDSTGDVDQATELLDSVVPGVTSGGER